MTLKVFRHTGLIYLILAGMHQPVNIIKLLNNLDQFLLVEVHLLKAAKNIQMS
jgi:hypothetical protein